VISLDGPRTAGDVLRDMVLLWLAAWRTHLVIGFVVVTPVYLAVFGLGLSEVQGRYDGSPSQGREFLEGGVLFALILPLVMTMVGRALAPDATPGRAIQGGLDRFAAACAVAVVAIVVSLAGLFALIIPGIYLAVRLCLAVPATALEDLGPADALRRSFALTAGPQLWRVLGLMLLVLMATGLVEAIIELPANALADTTDREGIALAGSIISYAITLPISAIGAALILFDARSRLPAPPPERVGGSDS
jgi:hypothetical protein